MKGDFLNNKLEKRKQQDALRSLRSAGDKIDFCSNDYLGIAKHDLIQPYLTAGLKHGSGGSRLLAGNYFLIEQTEQFIAGFHDAESGLIFNSGYDANIGIFSCVPQKGDIILYDNIIHASIRDGIRLSFAQAFSFLHNDVHDLEKKLAINGNNIFVVTESVFSMDGDTAPLKEMAELCEKFNANLIIDEAHATGVIGERGEGVVQDLHLQKKCFARVHTFGKACGAHGAIVLGSNKLRDYLINFARPFIYTTALPELSIAAIKASYQVFPSLVNEREHLNKLIQHFQKRIKLSISHQADAIGPKPSTFNLQPSTFNLEPSTFNLEPSTFNIPRLNDAAGQEPSTFNLQPSTTPIQAVIIPGNKQAKEMAEKLQQNNLDVRAILYPSVQKGSERLRIVMHSFNTFGEVDTLINILNS